MAKRCDKGKSCGGSCVSSSYKCQVDFDSKVSEVLVSLKKRAAKAEAEELDNLIRDLAKEPEANIDTSGDIKSQSYDTLRSKYKDSFIEENSLGKGAFGTVYAVGDYAIKVGSVEAAEVEMAILAGELGIGPKVKEVAPDKRESLIVMDRVKGETLDRLFGEDNKMAIRRGSSAEPIIHPDSTEVGQVMDSLVSQRGKMHRAGIRHGDCHCQNVLYDRDAKRATIIDWGFSVRGSSAGHQKDIRKEIAEVIPSYLTHRYQYGGKSAEEVIKIAGKVLDRAVLIEDGHFTIDTGLYGFRQAYDNSPNYRTLVNNFIRVDALGGDWDAAKTEEVYRGVN